MTEPHKYDPELGAITDQDREYATGLLDDLGLSDGTDAYDIQVVAERVRKIRYEAVIADRTRRG